MMKTDATCSVVILSFNRPLLLRSALASVVAQSRVPSEILVVDNRSPLSDAVAAVVAEFPSARLIANPVNGGFAAGMNIGIAQASGTYVYLSEDDLVLDGRCLERLQAHVTASAEPHRLLASPLLFGSDRRTVLAAGGTLRRSPIIHADIRAKFSADGPDSQTPFDVSFIPGCAIFTRRELVQDLRGFREDFFMYAEDVDFCIRALHRGHRAVIVPDAHAYHVDPPRASGSSLLDFHKIKNQVALHVLHAPIPTVGRMLRFLAARWLREPGLRRIIWRALGWNFRNGPRLLHDRLRERQILRARRAGVVDPARGWS
jgi:N-acetylglucosaminyl-diphospho-decaprenol L-rhamnosyltransferase